MMTSCSVILSMGEKVCKHERGEGEKHVLRLGQLLRAFVMHATQKTESARLAAASTSEMHPRTSIDDSGL